MQALLNDATKVLIFFDETFFIYAHDMSCNGCKNVHNAGMSKTYNMDDELVDEIVNEMHDGEMMCSIDHIKPVSSFTTENIHEMNHISNLQPLWAKDNLAKHNKLVDCDAKSTYNASQESNVQIERNVRP